MNCHMNGFEVGHTLIVVLGSLSFCYTENES